MSEMSPKRTWSVWAAALVAAAAVRLPPALTALCLTAVALLVYLLSRPANIVKKLALKRRAQRADELPPIYPNGWMPVAESRQLPVDRPLESIVCGQPVVLFRRADGRPTCLDAHCPHLGANLAHGGRVVRHAGENCIRCPFHGWRFAPDGACVAVPYTENQAPPKGVRIRQWTCTELNGYIFVWFHADDEPPSWQPIRLDEVHDGRWAYMGRTEHTVSCHFQEIPENGADIAHLNQIHFDSAAIGDCFDQSRLKRWTRRVTWHTWEAEWNPACMRPDEKPAHVNNILLVNRTWLFGWQVFQLRLRIQQVGPAAVNLRFDGLLAGVYRFDGAFVQAVQPLAPSEHRIVHQFYCGDSLLNRLLARLMLVSEGIMIERDIAMWNRKRFLRKPALVKEERSISLFRSWFTQFYSESSPTLQSLRDPLDW